MSKRMNEFMDDDDYGKAYEQIRKRIGSISLFLSYPWTRMVLSIAPSKDI